MDKMDNMDDRYQKRCLEISSTPDKVTEQVLCSYTVEHILHSECAAQSAHGYAQFAQGFIGRFVWQKMYRRSRKLRECTMCTSS